MTKENTKQIGDMSAAEFRKYGHHLVDWIADYLESIEDYAVLPKIDPGEIKSSLPRQPPITGESFEIILSDISKIMPGITHWNHPGFMAYFNSTSSGPGILADLLSSGLNVNGMSWHTCPSATELEELTLRWLAQMLGIPPKFWGIIYDTASVSSMHAVAAAREQAKALFFDEKEMNQTNYSLLRIYCSEQAHFSIDKSALTLGIPEEGIKEIPVDEEYRMIAEELSKAISEDRKNGLLPFCVVATVGTTSTASVDPVKQIASICNKEKIWLHVDAAYAGTASILQEMRWIFEGIEDVDSVVVNPHKWMFTPIDLSAFYTSKPYMLKKAFSLSAEYLKGSDKKEETNFMDYGIQLGRRFRALKLWFIIRYFGIEGIRNRIREHIRLAKMFANWIDESEHFERMAPVHLGVVCFRAMPKSVSDGNELNALNEKLLNNINSSGKLFLSHTVLNNKYTLRISISGIRTLEKNVKDAQLLLQNELNKLIS
ncbi:MAG: amino acid decarboxylase [Ignavibacterium sp.]|nr:MAG: amino acid decarboxylase [Ignavibacterium sp.]